MEVRTLARCLRSRPASSLLYAQQPGLAARLQPINHVRGQFLRVPSIRFNSSAASPNEASQPASANSEQSSSPSDSTTTTTPETQNANAAPSKSNPNESIDQILNELKMGSRQASANSATNPPSSSAAAAARRRLADPLSLSRAVGESAETDNYRTPVRRVELKLGTKLGRQVNVDPDRGVDLPTALRNLQIQCVVNRVRRQATAQKFHVRRGQRRKDLRRERWRKLFKFSFDQTVAKIQKMRAQGW
ncbi:hypothetical protein VTN00DRAFT_334 [Thermoascus crustaceus]|uniref:mitochondrial 37S ribosomal protein bS21m n=1 Tax=Thermoascus crustaceus TaxID=5088 RepID=UPI003743F49F